MKIGRNKNQKNTFIFPDRYNRSSCKFYLNKIYAEYDIKHRSTQKNVPGQNILEL